MCDVVDLCPTRSVEFEGEMERLANDLTVKLFMVGGLLRGIRPGSRKYDTLVRASDHFVRALDTIETHVVAVEEEMDHLFADLVDGQTVRFQTYDESRDAIVTSTLTTRCHTVRIRRMRCDPLAPYMVHDNDDFFSTGLNFGTR